MAYGIDFPECVLTSNYSVGVTMHQMIGGISTEDVQPSDGVGPSKDLTQKGFARLRNPRDVSNHGRATYHAMPEIATLPQPNKSYIDLGEEEIDRGIKEPSDVECPATIKTSSDCNSCH
jgi:hypothetical protein